MDIRTFSMHVSDEIGNVTAEAYVPEKAFCAMTLAHGAGAGMYHAFMAALAQALGEQGIATLRFNFPFAEYKKGRPDSPAVAQKTVEAAIHLAGEVFPAIPLFAAGKSFGGRMSSQLISAHPNPAVKGLVFFGFPLHPAGKPSVERAEHLKAIKIPMLFLQGTRDELAELELIESVCASLPKAELVKIDRANHMFKVGKQDVVPLLASTSHDWLKKQIKTGKKQNSV